MFYNFQSLNMKVAFFDKLLENQNFLVICAENLSIFVIEGQLIE